MNSQQAQGVSYNSCKLQTVDRKLVWASTSYHQDAEKQKQIAD